MGISAYLCWVVGETKEHVAQLHSTTVKRVKASAIAIHIPVLLWLITGYMVAWKIFELDLAWSVAVGVICAGLIYSIERLVQLGPRSVGIAIVRFGIGAIIATLGAFTFDLVMFDREVAAQLKKSALTLIQDQYEKEIAAQREIVEQKRSEWNAAEEAAKCEANGTCGSKVRSTGPIYRELKARAEFLRQQYLVNEQELKHIHESRLKALSDIEVSDRTTRQAGLLDRIAALDERIRTNNTMLTVFVLFFILVLFLEMMVLLVKLLFGETIDDKVEKMQARIHQHKAEQYEKAVISPVADARLLLDRTWT